MPSVWNSSSTPIAHTRRGPRIATLLLVTGLAMVCGGLLSGCAPAIIGGTAVGVSVIHDRRPTSAILADQQIELAAIDRYDKTLAIARHSRISATSYNRVVLLTGQAETAQVRDRYARMISYLPQVRKVVDQVTVGPNASVTQTSKDAYLTSRIKVALASVKIAGFDPTRVKVVTESGIVHLMGLLTPTEAQAVIAKVRYVPGVVQVVNLFETYRESSI
ncbi:putative periplasmic or secreted lipoprotein [Thioflavicoccus mobilis 8321]|uniref:Putative periplasmic or secreted lipoprotein n=1 Tax=Thioflavicoccus mobilis 8321 TaxID=765912 RepID=L0GXZ8_9GAMM|nr:putative periplasmic or secreted lipoprotein [Thioflavicoccus mobilis 8321]